MQRHKWLFEDAVTRAPLPLAPGQAQLHLLGFLLPEDRKYPAALEMVAEAGGKRYRISTGGYMHQLNSKNPYDLRDPDIPALPGTHLVPGAKAYALSAQRILTGRPGELRAQLRGVLADSATPPSVGLEVLNYLQRQPEEVLTARAYARGGLKEMSAQQVWLDLGRKIRRTVRTPQAAPAL